MNEERQKARKHGIRLFLSCLCIACVCFGIVAYLVIAFRQGELTNPRIVTISKIIVFIGVFFLVIAFGHVLPNLISRNKQKSGESGTSNIFGETNMRRALEKYIPNGETLLAGIHAVGKETKAICVFGECTLTEDRLLPDKNGRTVTISKQKYSAYDLYIGITQYSLVMADCEAYRYYYQFDNEASGRETDIEMVTNDILLADIGKCFRLADIQSCEVKKGWMGSVNCNITMKNGSYFKLMFPKLGGISWDMPHHTEYRDAIIARLSGSNI